MSMNDKERIQINVNLSAGQMEQLRALADHYGSISAAVRVAIDALWRERGRSVQVGAAISDHYAEDADTDTLSHINEPDI